MKITTWNVNGFRSAYSKGLADWVAENQPDVLCLQEVKVKPEQLDPGQQTFPGYTAVWSSAQRPGYSGVASFFRTPAAEAKLGLGETRFDVEGRVVTSLHDGFILYNIYFPNGQRDQERLDYKLDFYATLLEQCDRLHSEGKQVIITGDFNTAHNEIDLANPKQNEMNSGFLPEERAWIDRYLEHSLVDAYRELYPERVEYTWWTCRFNARKRNVGWRLDYFMISSGLMARVRDVKIHGDGYGSDHAPVTLEIE
jgi:exodeoxyribonuclease III